MAPHTRPHNRQWAHTRPSSEPTKYYKLGTLCKMEENPKARAALLAAVKEQIESKESPYVGRNYKRLVLEGYQEQEILELLGSVLAVEMWEMSTLGRAFDEKQYIERLEKLPDTSWMDEE